MSLYGEDARSFRPSPRSLFRAFGDQGSIIASLGGSDASADQHELMARYLYRRLAAAKLMQAPMSGMSTPRRSNDEESVPLFVALQRPDGTQATAPSRTPMKVELAMRILGVSVAFTMRSEMTQLMFRNIDPMSKEIFLGQEQTPIQIVVNLDAIVDGNVEVDTATGACILCDEGVMLAWADSIETMLPHGLDIEGKLLSSVWAKSSGTPTAFGTGTRTTPDLLRPPRAYKKEAFVTVRDAVTPPERAHSAQSSPYDSIMNEKMNIIYSAIQKEEHADQQIDPNDEEAMRVPHRPFRLIHSVLIGCAMILVIVVEMLCISKLLVEYRLDKSMTRFALVATIPLFAFLSFFFMIVIMGSLCQLFGPLSAVQGNSRYYSAIAPNPARHRDYELPHVTIQMPVYVEALKATIMPTVESLLNAIRFYEQCGGTASIFVNEDGMQHINSDLAEARKIYYELHNIGWVARPKHSKEPGGFQRTGHFKKASNMNYCLDFSLRVEDEMLRLRAAACIERGMDPEDFTFEEEEDMYQQAMEAMLTADEGRTMAAGNIRMGEIILIVDSDTRVPENCLLMGALEMHESPEVAIIQHASGILQVTNQVFENGITYFTDLIYNSIKFAVGNGDCAPFVGHNAFLRWKAIQSVSYKEDGVTKFWSDKHVSEDFDVSLRLQMNDFVVRLAGYHKGDFKEGVSLTVYDELARWEKYAYGCNELVFNPLIRWPTRGPFTRLFMRFLFSNIKASSKTTILAYIGTYYAIASALPLSLANYLIVGWFSNSIDQFYLTSWKIFVGMAVVFNVLSPLAYAMLRHRLGNKTFFWSVIETIKWTPMFVLFFGGLSFHLSKAILCHFLSIKMEWTTTAKELKESGFRVGLDRIVKDFKWMYLCILPIVAGMIYLAAYAPRDYNITDFAVIVPLSNQIGCHAVLPFALGLF